MTIVFQIIGVGFFGFLLNSINKCAREGEGRAPKASPLASTASAPQALASGPAQTACAALPGAGAPAAGHALMPLAPAPALAALQHPDSHGPARAPDSSGEGEATGGPVGGWVGASCLGWAVWAGRRHPPHGCALPPAVLASGSRWPSAGLPLWRAPQDVEEVMQRDGGVQNRLLRSNIRNYFAEHWHPESGAPGRRLGSAAAPVQPSACSCRGCSPAAPPPCWRSHPPTPPTPPHPTHSPTPPTDLDSRFLLFRELPPLLRLQLLRERQKPVLAQLGFMPPGLPASKRHAVERAVAAASLPVWLNAGCELSEAVSEVSAKAGQQAPSGAGRVFPVSGINEGPHFFVLEEGGWAVGVGGWVGAAAWPARGTTHAGTQQPLSASSSLAPQARCGRCTPATT